MSRRYQLSMRAERACRWSVALVASCLWFVGCTIVVESDDDETTGGAQVSGDAVAADTGTSSGRAFRDGGSDVRNQRGRPDASHDGVAPTRGDVRSATPRLEARSVLRFGHVELLPNSTCDRSTQLVTLRNTGGESLDIEEIRIRNNRGFWLTYPDPNAPNGSDDGEEGGSDRTGSTKKKADEITCSKKHPTDLSPAEENSYWPPEGDTLDGTLQPGESLDLRVWFEPRNSQSVDDTTLRIEWEGDTARDSGEWLEIDLIAQSNTPCLQIDPQSVLNFRTVTSNEEVSRRVSIRNCRLESQPSLTIRNIDMTNDADGAFRLAPDTLPDALRDDGTVTLERGETMTVSVLFTPSDATRTYAGALEIESNDADRGTHTLDLYGRSTDNACPDAVAEVGLERERYDPRWQRGNAPPRGNEEDSPDLVVDPLDTVKFRGTNSSDPDGSVERYEWTILDRPNDGGVRTLRPGPEVKKPTLRLVSVGTYRVELIVYDDKGVRSCGERSVVTIEARPQEDIHVQLVWDTPGDPDQTDDRGTDLDLHYVRSTEESAFPNWNNKDPGNDIFWANKTADWGPEGAVSDPSLDIDDTNGKGPENINHDNPNPKREYKVGVHYYADRGFGPSFATVRIYLEQELAREFEDKRLRETGLFWYVGKIDWNNRIILERDTIHDGFPN